VVADTRIYLGRPGALAAIRSPRGAFEAPRSRRTSTFELGLGGASVDQMIGGARTYTINYEMLLRDDWTTLQAFLDGHEGPGPFVLLDPGQRNMLPANVAAATSVTNSPDGFPCVGGFDLIGVADNYNRSAVASGWGTSTSGHVWTTSGGLAAEHATTGTTGTQSSSTINVFRIATIDTGYTDFDITVDVALSVGTPTGAAIAQWICGRWADSNNYYVARLTFSTSGLMQLQLFRRSGGTLSSALAAATLTSSHVADSMWRVHFTGVGSSLAASAWLRDTGSEPSTPQVTATDATLTTGTSISLLTRLESGNTNTLPVVSTWDNLSAAPGWAALTSSAAYTDAGPRVLALTFTAAITTGTVITVAWPSSTFAYGVPVVAGRALCFSCYVRGGGGDPVATYTPQIVWRAADGSVVSTTSGTPVASASGAWAQMSATATPPATAVYADPRVSYTSGASAGTIGYFRRFLLNEGSEPDTTWSAGTGVWPVRVVAGQEAWPLVSPELRTGPTVVFQEDVS